MKGIMDASSMTEYVTVVAEPEASIALSQYQYWSTRIKAMLRGSTDSDEEEVASDNREVFKSLQMLPKWGHFFVTFGDGGIHNLGDMVVGRKFAEGGQAELYEAQIDWRNPADRGKPSIIKEQIERSKAHWTQLVQPDSSNSINCCEILAACFGQSEESAEVSNKVVFRDLQKHPNWGTFFYKFAKGEMAMATTKFAEGAQAELYHARIKWRTKNWRKLFLREGEGEDVLEDPSEYVLKVFKEGTFLEQLKETLPQAMLKFHAERKAAWMTRRYNCDVVCGTLLEDGRFAFVLQREQTDLRSLIDRRKNLKIGQDGGPFPKEAAENYMYEIALGMEWLHDHKIVHRDLKASNVLVREDNLWNYCFVADYECSVGTIGTGFWRAPEILEAVKARNANQRPELFTEAADVYGYGMTCYEILTGELPFEGHRNYEYDLVLSRQTLQVPEHVDVWVSELLRWCWQYHPADRPSFKEILYALRDNSTAVQGHISMEEDRTHPRACDWSHPKTEVIRTSELARMLSAKRKEQVQLPKNRKGFYNEYVLRNLRQSQWVLKVFKKGTVLQVLKSQWPEGMLEFHAERMERAQDRTKPEWMRPRNASDILCGTLLADGRFAFLVERQQEDLQSLIDRHMKLSATEDRGPLSTKVAEEIMHNIALGMDWLHTFNIVHRDLNPRNVLVTKDTDENYQCFVADYECSIGVIGTRFFRAPEIEQAWKDKAISQRPELFTKAVDVYSYGMTCYELLTGKLLYKDHPLCDNWPLLSELVINGLRPTVPDFVDDWVRELLSICWHSDPSARPSFGEILKSFEKHKKTSEEFNPVLGA